MSKITVKAAMVPSNDLAAAQTAFESAVSSAYIGEEIAVSVAALFPEGVDAVATSLGVMSAGSIRWTPLAEAATPWIVTATDTGRSHALIATVTPRRRVYAPPAFTVSLGAVVAGQSVGAPGESVDVAMRAFFTESGDPARTESDVAFALLVNGVAAPLPHVARAGEVLIAQGHVDHPTGAQTRQSAPVAASAPSAAPVVVEPPSLAPKIAQVGEVIRLSEARAEGYPVPGLDHRLILDGVDITAQIEGLEWVATTTGSLVWRVTAANGAGPEAIAQATGTIAPSIMEAAAPNAVADVLPGVMTVGEALAPGAPAQNGPNLVTEANAGTFPAQNVNRLYVAGDEGYLQFDVTAAPTLNSVVLTQAAARLPVGAVLLCENLAASPRSIRFVNRTSGVNTTIADVAPGGAVEHVVAEGFEDIRLSVYAVGVNLRVRIRVRDATPARAQRDFDLGSSFTGGTPPVSIAVAGLPAGITATNGVISGDQIPAAGAGGDHVVTVRATDALGLYREVEREVRVTEPFSIQSVTISNATDAAQGLAEGDTATMDLVWRGWPGPHPANSGLWPQWRRIWRDQNGVVIGSGPNVTIPQGVAELQASAYFQLDATGSVSPTVAASPVRVAAAVTAPEAPVVTAPTSATVASRTVIIAPGEAGGAPAPIGEITALTINGQDMMGSLSGDRIDAPGTGTAQVEWIVTWRNAAGTATSPGSVTLAASESTAPGVIAAGDWRVVSAVADGASVYLAIDRVPDGATRIDLEVAGVVQALEYVAPGVFTVTGRPANVAQDYRLRVVNISGAGPWSDVKSAMATAASNTRLACWADGETAHALTVAPTGAGAGPAMTEGVNKPFGVTGGGEAEVIQWSTSKFKTENPAAPASFFDGIFYDPLGTGAALKPAEISQREITTSLGATKIIVYGAAGMVTQPCPAAVGWDADGDPVPFKFDRMVEVGRLPDGRPFVVGPVGIVHNGGDPVAVTPDATRGYSVVSDRGAALCVVARKGIIPPVSTPADLGLSHAYVRRAGVYDFAADGWNEAAAAAAPATGVTLRPTFETCGVYYAGTGTATCKVRFRKTGDANFYPAHDLWYDDRSLAGHPAAFLAASKHRGILHYLEPGAKYEVQIKDGATYRKATVTAWSYKPAAKTARTLGAVAGNVTVSRAGDTLTVSRGTLAPLVFDIAGGKWAEVADGQVAGAITLDDDVERLILRDVDNFGAPAQGIKLGAANRDIRILGGRSSGWAGLDATTGFGRQMDNAIWAPTSPDAMESIVIMGRQFGSPRYAASMWEEGGHPWGPGLFAWRSASGSGSGSGPVNGRMVYAANSAAAWNLRTYYDGIGGTASNKAGLTTTGGYGCDSYVGWNYTSGTADENAELEGSGANMVVEHNVFWCREARSKTAIATSLGLSWVAHGPMLICRNLHVYEPESGRVQAEAEINTYKVQAYRTASDPAWAQTRMGRKLIYHETAVSTRLNFNKPLSNTSSVLLGCHLRNNIMRANSASHSLAHATNLRAASHLEDTAGIDPDKTLDAHWRPTGAGVVGRGEWIANVNDGGPFFRAKPDIGALSAG